MVRASEGAAQVKRECESVREGGRTTRVYCVHPCITDTGQIKTTRHNLLLWRCEQEIAFSRTGIAHLLP
jgi:hypothetical protein